MKVIIYKIIALLTLGGALALGVVILHFTLAEVEITITANQIPTSVETDISIQIQSVTAIHDESFSAEATGDTTDTPDNTELTNLRNAVLGENDSVEETTPPNDETPTVLKANVYTLPITMEHTVVPSGVGKEIEDQATGKVTLINELSVNQILVATTRLLTPDEILFRIKDRVVVPAGGSVEVEAFADLVGPAGDIGPTAFVIPGLSPERQKAVYAKNDAPFTGGSTTVKVLGEPDFEKAEAEAEEMMRTKALEEFTKRGFSVNSHTIYLTEIAHTSSDTIGEEKDSLSVASSAEARAVVFNETALLNEVKLHLAKQVPHGQTILAYNEPSFFYDVSGITEDESHTIISTYLEGFATVEDGNNLIAKEELVGLSREQIQEKLLQNKAVQAVQVQFSPFWVSRAPKIADKITITIKEAGS